MEKSSDLPNGDRHLANLLDENKGKSSLNLWEIPAKPMKNKGKFPLNLRENQRNRWKIKGNSL